jgi:hypothetical protein
MTFGQSFVSIRSLLLIPFQLRHHVTSRLSRRALPLFFSSLLTCKGSFAEGFFLLRAKTWAKVLVPEEPVLGDRS